MQVDEYRESLVGAAVTEFGLVLPKITTQVVSHRRLQPPICIHCNTFGRLCQKPNDTSVVLLRSLARGTDRRSVFRSRGWSSERGYSSRKPRPHGHVRVRLLQLPRGAEWRRSCCSLAAGGECGCSYCSNVARGGDEGRRFCSIARGRKRGCRFGSLAGGGE
jgi:hypothetical protein